MFVLGFNNRRFGRLVADWSIENMTRGMIPYGLLFTVGVFPEKKIPQTSNINENGFNNSCF